VSDTTFTQLLDLAVGTVVVASFAALWLRRLAGVVRVLAVQGVALAAVALLLGIHESEPELVGVAVMVAVLRGVILPGLIMRAVRATATRIEVDSVINVPSSLLAAAVLTLVAYAVSRNLVALADAPHARAMPLGIAVALIGILMLVTRRKAIMQIGAILMLDNGIALVMFLGTSGVPLAVELGIASDVLLAMLVLQVLTNRIHVAFGGGDLDQLTELRD
jgi:hydrogenase-4 component E